MTDFYVRTSGNDGNAGTSPATAWQTVTKALSDTGIGSGDTVYIGGGVYRETVSVGMSSPAAQTFVIGDVEGLKTGDPGEVQITGWTSGDNTTPNWSNFQMQLNAVDNLTFENLSIIGSGNSTADMLAANSMTSQHIIFRNCYFEGTMQNLGGTHARIDVAASTVLDWTFDRCDFNVTGRGIGIFFQANPTADIDLDVVFDTCRIFQPGRAPFVRLALRDATNTFGAGGVKFRRCSYFGGGQLLEVASAEAADGANACTVEHCNIQTHGFGALIATTAGQIVEDWNFFSNVTAHTNVSNGANSHAPANTPTKRRAVHMGQERIWAEPIRPFGTPVAGSPLLGWSSQVTAPGFDVQQRDRPAGGGSVLYAAGALERHDTARRGTVIPPDSGSAIEIVGPGDHAFEVPVDATTTTISVKVRTSGYVDVNGPEVQITNGGEVGLPILSVSATTASEGAWETVQFVPITPSKAGFITVRFINHTQNGTGIAAFDSFTVT